MRLKTRLPAAGGLVGWAKTRDSTGAGSLFIGFIGPHLTNTQTN